MEKSRSPKTNPFILFIILSYAIAWGLWIPSTLAQAGRISTPLPYDLAQVLGAWGPSLAGLVVIALTAGRRGLGRLFRRLLIWRVGLPWYVFVLFWPAFLSLLVTGITLLAGESAPDFANPLVLEAYPLPAEARALGALPLLPMVFVIQFLGSSLGEELGWRGYALPRLQSGMTALGASLVIGLIWGLWHLPRLWTPGVPYDWAAFGWLAVDLLIASVLYTWVFNNTRSSLLLALLFHTSQAITPLFLAHNQVQALESLIALSVTLMVVITAGPWRLTRKADMDSLQLEGESPPPVKA